MAAPMRTTLTDVARHAGVSVSTASRVLHGGAGVAAAKADRVTAAAAALGYSVNHSARSLRRGRDQAVGLVVEDFSIPFFGRIATQVELAARTRDHGVVIACSGSGASEELAVASLLTRNVAGLIVGGGTGRAPADYLSTIASRMPLVVVDAAVPDRVADTVTVDNVAGGRTATAHLLAHGHQDVLFVGSVPAATTVQARLLGHTAALQEADLPVREELVVWAGLATSEVRPAVRAALQQHPDVTSVFSSGARTTPGTLSAMADLGRRHLAFVGMDDVEGAEAFVPALTVVEQDAEAMARCAVALLFERIDGYTGPARHREVGLTFHRRGSGEVRPVRPHDTGATAAPVTDPACTPRKVDHERENAC